FHVTGVQTCALPISDKDLRETQALALLATGNFIDAGNAGTAAYGSFFERAGNMVGDMFSDEDSKVKVGFNYTQRERNPYSESDRSEERRVRERGEGS